MPQHARRRSPTATVPHSDPARAPQPHRHRAHRSQSGRDERGHSHLDAGHSLSEMASAMGLGTDLLGVGSNGPSVQALQEALGMPTTEQDGWFGPRTRNAVIEFQRQHHLDTDGIVGPLTRRALRSHTSNTERLAAPERTGQPRRQEGPASESSAAPAPSSALPSMATERRNIRRGATGDTVREIQQLLGLEEALRTGTFDDATHDAVRRFQQDASLDVDGVVGPQTLTALLRRSATTAIDRGSVFEEGDSGPGVLALQQALGMSAGGQTGIYGPTTASQVRTFQNQNGIEATGRVGPTTWNALKASGALPGRYIGKFDAYSAGNHIGRIDVVEIDGRLVAARTARAWNRLKAAAARDGVRLKLNSGFRTHAEQERLYRAYLRGTGNLAAPPGHSNHQDGSAIDVDVVSDAAYDWMHANAPGLGWRRTVPSEPWHWEYFGR